MATQRVSAAVIRAALKERFPLRSHALLFEVANGTGGSARRRLDAVAMGLWPSHGLQIDGIEIKVSRSDFQREMREHSKAGEIYKYCDRFWIAAPQGMLKPGEIPETWGLLEYTSNGTLRQRKPATRDEADVLDRGFVAAMLRRAAEGYHQDIDEAVQRLLREARDEDEKLIQREVDMRLSGRIRQAEKALEKAHAVKEATGVDLLNYQPAKHIVECIKFADSFSANQYGGIGDIINRMQGAIDGLMTIQACAEAGGSHGKASRRNSGAQDDAKAAAQQDEEVGNG